MNLFALLRLFPVSNQPTYRHHNRAKVIDMIFFIESGTVRTSPEP
jgi:hypothetical protein